MRAKIRKLLISGFVLLSTFTLAFVVCVPWLRKEPTGYFGAYPLSGHSDSDVFIFSGGTVRLETCCGHEAYGTYKRIADGRWLWHIDYRGWKSPLDFEISPGALYLDARCVSKEFGLLRLRRTLFRPSESVSGERAQLTPVNESVSSPAGAAPSEPSSVAAPHPEPQEQVSAFFKNWEEKNGAFAIQELTKGTHFATHRAQIEAHVNRLQIVTAMYGKVSRVESVEKLLSGESFMRLRLISYHASQGVVFWEFMFARPESDWHIHSFRFNDDFYLVFGDVPSRQSSEQKLTDGVKKE
ncbi:hypothetical protein ACXR0O_25150 [Verrucomicrobiota bacterium sgz303538]